ncbi:uncharacterized protein LOC121754951 [Salvia splendens]|uniref:uncharacterized protein LOC121754951 n=1 Tax=Salvia splendens TaxID=180675 RepID=UPI001C27C67B|nr:uncharacterized protein LOC121754951 [Salvia splendens]
MAIAVASLLLFNQSNFTGPSVNIPLMPLAELLILEHNGKHGHKRNSCLLVVVTFVQNSLTCRIMLEIKGRAVISQSESYVPNSDSSHTDPVSGMPMGQMV